MLEAVDCATDETVGAWSASRYRNYRCKICYAPVRLKDGERRAIHFAHAAGQADPDCEDYFGGTLLPRHRRGVVAIENRIDERASDTKLFFEFGPSGPTLSLWIPATRACPQWSGSVHVITPTVTRQLSWAHLKEGKLVPFPLADGQWQVSTQGEIDVDYSSFLSPGLQTLEGGLNLFEGTRALGKQIGPTSSLCLGDAVWVVTRDKSFGARCPSLDVECELKVTVGGWVVFLVTLPMFCEMPALRSMMRWLERRIRFPKARVWIESPLPIRQEIDGTWLFVGPINTVQIKADQLLDLEIVNADSNRSVLRIENSSRVDWTDIEDGRWCVRANGTEFVHFRIASDEARRPPVLLVQVDGEQVQDLFHLQRDKAHYLTRKAEALSIEWSIPAISRLIQVNGARLADTASLTCHLRFADLTEVRVANLGFVTFDFLPTERVLAVENRVAEKLRATARWLLTLAHADPTATERVPYIPAVLASEKIFERLAASRWSSAYAVHVRALSKELRRIA